MTLESQLKKVHPDVPTLLEFIASHLIDETALECQGALVSKANSMEYGGKRPDGALVTIDYNRDESGPLDSEQLSIYDGGKMTDVEHLEKHTSQVYVYISDHELGFVDKPTVQVPQEEEIRSLHSAIKVAFEYLGKPEFAIKQMKQYSTEID